MGLVFALQIYIYKYCFHAGVLNEWGIFKTPTVPWDTKRKLKSHGFFSDFRILSFNDKVVSTFCILGNLGFELFDVWIDNWMWIKVPKD
jgi:hypothetical protein